MKKKIFVLLLMTFITLTGCSSKNLKTISLDELNKKIEAKETFVLYTASKDNDLEKTITKVLEEKDITGYKLDTSNLSQTEGDNLKITIDYADPSVIFIIKGIDPTKLSHITDENITSSEIIARLEDMGFITK